MEINKILEGTICGFAGFAAAGVVAGAIVGIGEKIVSKKNIKNANTATLMLREIRDNIDDIDPKKLSGVDQGIYREIKSSINSALFWDPEDERFLRLVSMSRELKASATK